MTSLPSHGVAPVALSLARKMPPSLVLQPERARAFVQRASEGSLAALLQASPQGGKTTFLKQILRELESNSQSDTKVSAIYWIEVSRKISATEFAEVLGRMISSPQKSLIDLATQIEEANALLIVDNLDQIENSLDILNAFTSIGSRLRLIASVTQSPDIPAAMALEVSSESYEGLTEEQTQILVQKVKPKDSQGADQAWSLTRGHPYLLRLLLTAQDFKSAQREYWTSTKDRLPANILGAINKAALCLVANESSQSFFLSKLSEDEWSLLKQMRMAEEGSHPGDLRLAREAREWALKDLKAQSERRDHLVREMIEELKDNATTLELQEELCRQYQVIGDLTASAEIAKVVVPKLYDQIRFKSVESLTDAILLQIDPHTWVWRRMSISDAAKSLQELGAILDFHSSNDGDSTKLPLWHALRLVTVSRLEDWKLFDRYLNESKELIEKDLEAKCWMELSHACALIFRDTDLMAARTTVESVLLVARTHNLHLRLILDALVTSVTISGDMGQSHTSLKYLDSLSRVLREHGRTFEGPVSLMLSFDNNIYLGNSLPKDLGAAKFLASGTDEVTGVLDLQRHYLRIIQLIYQGKLSQADQECRQILPDALISRITPRIYRIYEAFLQSRLTVGAVLEVKDVLRSFISNPLVAGTASVAQAEMLLKCINSIDKGDRPIPLMATHHKVVCKIDYVRAIITALEYDWISGRLLSTAEDFEIATQAIDPVEFPHHFHQVRLLRALFSLARRETISANEFSGSFAFFVERDFPLFALRSYIAMSLQELRSGNAKEAQLLASQAKIKFEQVESMEDQAWLTLILSNAAHSLGNTSEATKLLNTISSLSNVNRSVWFQERIHSSSPSRPLVREPSAKSALIIDESELKVRRGNGEVFIKDRPVLVTLLITLKASYPNTLSKEQLCDKVWNEVYNPLVHDTRVYTSIRRLRDLLDEELEDGLDAIVAVDGRYRLSPACLNLFSS